MQKLRRTVVVDRESEAIFALIDGAARYPEFMVGITRWELCSQKRRGLGAEFRVLMKVGSIEAGGLLRVTDWEEPRTIAWRSERGVRQQGRWTLTPREDGSTEVALEIGYDLGGGPIGRFVELLVGRIVGGNMAATLLAVRRIVEFEE